MVTSSCPLYPSILLTIKHHKVVGPGKEPRYIPPHVKLPIELVHDHMDVHKLAHVRIGLVHVVQL